MEHGCAPDVPTRAVECGASLHLPPALLCSASLSRSAAPGALIPIGLVVSCVIIARQLAALTAAAILGAQEAVTWMVDNIDIVKSRRGAVRLGRQLVRHRLIHHVVDGHDFQDEYLFFRFYSDEEQHPHRWWRKSLIGKSGRKLSTATERGVGARPTSGRGAGASAAVAAGLTWRFQAHTKANSISLSIAVAEAIEASVAAGDLDGMAIAFADLRKSVRSAARPTAEWVVSTSRTTEGVVDVYRQHMDGKFQTLKTSGLVKCEGGPEALAAKFVDVDARRPLEACYDYAFEIERLPLLPEVAGGGGGGEADGDGEGGADSGDGAAAAETGAGDSSSPGDGTPGTPSDTAAAPGAVAASPPAAPVGLSTSGGARSATSSASGRSMSSASMRLPRVDTAAEAQDSDSDEELLHEKFARFVGKSRRLSKLLGITPNEQRVSEEPELDEGRMRQLSRERSSTAVAGGEALAAAAAGSEGDAASTPRGPVAEADLIPMMRSTPPRVLYRKLLPAGTLMSPRDLCVLQDWFEDEDGTFVVYDVSVQHTSVPPAPKIARGEVLIQAYVIEPCERVGWVRVTIISQFDPRGKSPRIFRPVYADVQSTVAMETIRAATKSPLDLLDGGVKDIAGVPMISEAAGAFGDGSDGPMPSMSPTAAGGSEEDGGAAAPTESSIRSRSMGIDLNSFDMLAVLGRGGYGKVMMVRKKDSGSVYAMKVLRKKDITAKKQVERTMTERDILVSVDHPYIVGLRYAFQTPSKLYMVIDFVSGGDFFTLLSREGTVGERRAQLYMAELLLALHHLHLQGIVYRDLKPENVLLDKDGHIKLTDFGLSRFFEQKRVAIPDLPGAGAGTDASSTGGDGEAAGDATAESPRSGAAAGGAGGAGTEPTVDTETTHSFCGTEQYMAPEVLLQRGHGHAVDYWCSGILFSEMLTGRHPFRGANHFATLKNIVNPNVRPATLSSMSPAAASLMQGLLRRKVSTRLGSEDAGGFDGVKAHPFFHGLDWKAVEERRVDPEYKPRVRAADDVSNFDRVFTRERPVDSVADGDGDDDSEEDGGGFFGFFKSKKPKKKKTDERPDLSFRGFSYAAPSTLDRSSEIAALQEGIEEGEDPFEEEEAAGTAAAEA